MNLLSIFILVQFGLDVPAIVRRRISHAVRLYGVHAANTEQLPETHWQLLP